jgi:hypothetical protein
MSKPELKCPKCGLTTAAAGIGEMVRSDPATGKVLSARRFPWGVCPEHGMFMNEEDEIPGHHVTMRHLKTRAPKRPRRAASTTAPPPAYTEGHKGAHRRTRARTKIKKGPDRRKATEA